MCIFINSQKDVNLHLSSHFILLEREDDLRVQPGYTTWFLDLIIALDPLCHLFLISVYFSVHPFIYPFSVSYLILSLHLLASGGALWVLVPSGGEVVDFRQLNTSPHRPSLSNGIGEAMVACKVPRGTSKIKSRAASSSQGSFKNCLV